MNPEPEYIVAHDLVVDGVKIKGGTPLSELKSRGGVWTNKGWTAEAARCGHLIEAPTVPVDPPSDPPGTADDDETDDEDEESGPVNATDSAIALAEEHGLDLSKVAGTGKDGRITQPDVKAALDQKTAP